MPLMALRFAFEGGNAQDPAGKEGLANFLTAMMDEGAGDLNSERLPGAHGRYRHAHELRGQQGRLLRQLRDADRQPRQGGRAAEARACTKPRFDADAVERIRQQLLANLALRRQGPRQGRGRANGSRPPFPGHPYGRPANGTQGDASPRSRATISRPTASAIFAKRQSEGRRGRRHRRGRRSASCSTTCSATLPAKADLTPGAADDAGPTAASKRSIEMDVPQSVAVVRPRRHGRARTPTSCRPSSSTSILGGGGFASQLMEEVREKRGLAYSVYSYIQPLSARVDSRRRRRDQERGDGASRSRSSAPS